MRRDPILVRDADRPLGVRPSRHPHRLVHRRRACRLEEEDDSCTGSSPESSLNRLKISAILLFSTLKNNFRNYMKHFSLK